MNTLKLTGRFAGVLALAAIWGAPAAAQCPSGHTQVTEVHTDNFGPEIGNWGTATIETLTAPKFVPPAGATLIRAEVTLCGRVNGTASFTNNDNQPCTLTYSVSASVTADPADPASPINNFNVPNIAATGGPFDLPANGGSGNDAFDSGQTCALNSPQIFTNPAQLAWFIASPGDETVVIDHSGITSSQHFGCGVVTFDSEVFSRLTFTVTYVYCLEGPPPGEGCICTGPSPHYRRPGSLLLYPEFDNREGDVTVLTVTNTDCGRQSPDVRVEFIFISEDTCAEFNRTTTLTACDTFTMLTKAYNPGMQRGYVYAFAKDALGRPIVWNHLIGSLLVINGFEAFDYSMNPVVFRGIGSNTGIIQPDGTLTDLDGDGIRDLDNAEYEPAPDVITVPRFFGQDLDGGKAPALFKSELILINLSGGSQFTTRIDCLLYNDNEQAFSFEHEFYCWEKIPLLDITFAFSNTFLKSTEHDQNEILGAPTREAGWLCCDGAFASSSQETIVDPAFYMVLVERVGSFGAADLPFECGFQLNGALLPRHPLGDGDPTPVDGDNQ